MKQTAAMLATCTSLMISACAHATSTPYLMEHSGRTISRTAVGSELIVRKSGQRQMRYGLELHEHQWPGVYFEGGFTGDTIGISLNDNVNILKITVDNRSPVYLEKPGLTVHTLTGLGSGSHKILVEKITESQSDTATFAGFKLSENEKWLPQRPRDRQIEFIGDSFTVGYGNTSTTQTCTETEVWQTTDTSQAFGPLTAKAFNADYQINAFSGRGVVRNYDSFKGPTLPELYPYALFDGQTVYNNPDWQPQIIVIGLGTNDFSTPVKPDDKWADTEALHADYRRGYVAFVKDLRTRNPNAHFILMSSDRFDGSLRDNVRQVADTLRASGETRIDTLFFEGLDYGGCHFHPSLADHLKINSLLKEHLTAHPDLWQGK